MRAASPSPISSIISNGGRASYLSTRVSTNEWLMGVTCCPTASPDDAAARKTVSGCPERRFSLGVAGASLQC